MSVTNALFPVLTLKIYMVMTQLVGYMAYSLTSGTELCSGPMPVIIAVVVFWQIATLGTQIFSQWILRPLKRTGSDKRHQVYVLFCLCGDVAYVMFVLMTLVLLEKHYLPASCPPRLLAYSSMAPAWIFIAALPMEMLMIAGFLNIVAKDKERKYMEGEV